MSRCGRSKRTMDGSKRLGGGVVASPCQALPAFSLDPEPDLRPPTEATPTLKSAATGCRAVNDEPLARLPSAENQAACKSHPNPAGTLPCCASRDDRIPRHCREGGQFGETRSVLASSVPCCLQECGSLRYDR